MKYLPAEEIHIALFLASLYQQEESTDVIESCYKLYLTYDIFPSILCENIVAAAKRNRNKTKKENKPITVDDLYKIFKYIGENEC